MMILSVWAVSLLFLIQNVSICSNLHFNRAQLCIEMGLNTCKKWNTTVNFFYYNSFYSACFPAQTKVKTKDGYKLMSELTVN